MKKKYLTALFAFVLASNVNAQKFGVLSAQEKRDLKLLAKEYFEEFHSNLKTIPQIVNSKVKKKRIKQFLRKFLPDAKIQIAGRSGVSDILATDYFRKKLSHYGQKFKIVSIEITSVEFGRIKPVDNEPGVYYIDFIYVQRYCRSNKNRDAEGIAHWDYCDNTTKKGRFYIKRVTTSAGARWKLYFGDIKVEDYQVLTK